MKNSYSRKEKVSEWRSNNGKLLCTDHKAQPHNCTSWISGAEHLYVDIWICDIKIWLLINGGTWPLVQVIYETCTIIQQKKYIWMVSGISMSRSGGSISLDNCRNLPIHCVLTVMEENAKWLKPDQAIHASAQNIILSKSSGNLAPQKELWGTHLWNNPWDTWSGKCSIECIIPPPGLERLNTVWDNTVFNSLPGT